MARPPGGVPTAHVDTLARDMLPPPADWPVFDYGGDNLPLYPDRLNAAATLLDGAIAEGAGMRPVFYFDGTVWTYDRLRDQVDRIAQVLVADFGLVPGNRVLLRSANSPMLAACWLAVLKAGGICVTTVPLLKADELRFIFDRVAVRFALADVGLAEDLEAAAPAAASLERISYFSPTGDGRVAAADLDQALARKSGGFAAVATAADDIALISFTSGTTGRPKAVAHYHRDILVISNCYPRVVPVRATDVISGAPSMAFTYGLAVFLIYPLRYRAAVVLMSQPTPDRILDAIERFRVTSLYGVPAAYNQLLREIDRYDVSSLRQCASSGENLQMPLWERWRERTGLRLINGFGATELICTFLSESPAVDRVGSTGRPVPGYTVRLVDDAGQPVPRNAQGRLAVRGPTGCRYLDDLEQQRAFVRDGWNITSDVFVEDGDGYFWFIDRSDNIIVSSGYNISPQEVERAMLEHPKVSECAVVGVRDPERGNLVRACVVLCDAAQATPDTARELQEFVKRRISPYKYPREVRFYPSLPKTHTGKLQRKQLGND